MLIKLKLYTVTLSLLFTGIMNSTAQLKSGQIKQVIDQSVQQYKLLATQVPPGQLPRTFEKGKVQTVGPYAWISGFYPGTLLYLYEQTKDSALLQEAEQRLKILEQLQTVKVNHDLGFMMYCSFGNAYRLTGNPKYKDILVQSARAICHRGNTIRQNIRSFPAMPLRQLSYLPH